MKIDALKPHAPSPYQVPDKAPDFTDLIERKIQECAKLLNLEIGDLSNWFIAQPKTNPLTMIALLNLMICHQLDPFAQELLLIANSDKAEMASPFITLEGWLKIIHKHPQFAGLAFESAPCSFDAIPIWMECVIYRKDLCEPIRIREYFTECAMESEYWKARPRRMLRQRTLTHCAQIAFGVSIGETSIMQVVENKTHVSSQISTKKAGGLPISHRQILKDRLGSLGEMTNASANP